MFDKFGEFDSAEEINRAAAAQLKEGDLDAIKTIAEENGLDPEDAEDFCAGVIDSLTTPLLAAIGKLEMESKDLGLKNMMEYYYSGRDKGRQKTDAEYANDLESWLDGTEIKAVIVDPAAASFIAELRKRGFRVIKAKNDVEDGIRLVSTKLNLIKIIFSNVCQNTIKEFASYIWDAKAAERGEDKPIKQYDHAMDAVRYFVYTIFGDKPRLNRNLKGGL